MNILLSAYACEPHKGSEPNVGWNHMLAYSRAGHNVCVMTRANNRNVVEEWVSQHDLKNVTFEYFDLPSIFLWLKRGNRGVHIYYFLWQVGIYFVAKRILDTSRIDFIHHATFVSIRQPSFLGLFNIPFIFGPVGGGEHATTQLRNSIVGIRGRMLELCRGISNRLVKFDPLMYITFRSASSIFVTSEQSKACVPKHLHSKTFVELGIGVDIPIRDTGNVAALSDDNALQILYAGQLIHWKGVHLAIAALKRLCESGASARLTIVGRGVEEKNLRSQAEEMGIDTYIDWVPWMSHEDMRCFYKNFDCFLYPSLHDSGGLVVLEALSCGTPVVCLDIGGPGVIVNESCGAAIKVRNRDVDQLVGDLAFAVQEVIKRDTSVGCRMRASHFSWSNLSTKIILKHGMQTKI